MPTEPNSSRIISCFFVKSAKDKLFNCLTNSDALIIISFTSSLISVLLNVIFSINLDLSVIT